MRVKTGIPACSTRQDNVFVTEWLAKNGLQKLRVTFEMLDAVAY